MSNGPLRALVIADFNAANLAAALSHDPALPQLDAQAAPYGDLGWEQALSTRDTPVADLAVVWTRAEAVNVAFARRVAGGPADLSSVLGEVDRFAERLARLGERIARVVVVAWTPPRLSAAFGTLAMRERAGLANVVMRMNLRLAERLEHLANVFLIDASGWIGAERSASEAKLWYAAKIPFGQDVFRRAARQVKSTMRASLGRSRKLIVLDLDDTLWGGLVGEGGWEGLRLGGHDPAGEAFVDFQRTLLALSERGILLAIASKNDERVALDAIARHPEMVLRREHFAAWRINWDDKAANIAALVSGLNLGLGDVVFIDDNASERARVREALPEVLVPDWPASPMQYVDRLLDLGCFDTVAVTDEDRARGEMYAAERARADDREAGTLDDWLGRLELRVSVEELNGGNTPRAVQLLNKTNQMNLSTRRLDGAALAAWLARGDRQLFTFRVADRFGDAGLSGIASVEVQGSAAVLVDFVLSCRVFGRQVEHAMLHTVSEWSREHGATQLEVSYLPTERNEPCLRFLRASGLREHAPQRFVWNLSAAYPLPAHLTLEREMEAVR